VYHRLKLYVKVLTMAVMTVELKGYGFRINISGESYFIKDNGDSFVLAEEVNREAVGYTDDKYANMGVSNIKELLCQLITQPNETLSLLGIKSEPIEKVVVEYS